MSYEIDLNAKNAQALRDAFAPYVGQARRVAGRKASSSRRATGGGRSDTNAVREWARANGYEVSDRGRISAQVQEAYAKAQG